MTKRPLLLDLFCMAGGAAVGYHRAGFDILGVDHKPQKRYPFDFIQQDAFEFLGYYGCEPEFAIIHTSPPCQYYSVSQKIQNNDHPDLIETTRHLLKATGKPYVIENVPGAPMINPLMLCGTMFGLGVIRHRLFETNPPIWFPPAACNHHSKTQMNFIRKSNNPNYVRRTDYVYGKDIHLLSVFGHSFRAADGRKAMQIDWMTRDELAQAVPPAYTEFIGRQFLKMAVLDIKLETNVPTLEHLK